MSRWCSDNALPLDLKCCGIHSKEGNVLPTNLSLFQPLQKLLDNAEAGIQYHPVRLTKGSYSEEGPATPQSAAPPKGSRADVANQVLLQQQQLAAAMGQSFGPAALDARPDVLRTVDQRLAGIPMNGISQQQQLQAQNFLSQLQQHPRQRQQQQQPPLGQQQQQRGMLQPGRQQQPGPQGRNSSSTRRMPGAGASSNPQQEMTGLQQHLQQQQQQQQQSGLAGSGAAAISPGQQALVPAATATTAAAAAAGKRPAGNNDAAAAAVPEVSPGSDAWNNALAKLLSRQGFSAKDADVKWRVILGSGDRVGPFSSEQMTDWLLRAAPPKGINKQQASATAANVTSLQLCGIISADYNNQRLPGAKFFKPLGQLVPAIAAGLAYEAVNKHDLQRGIPKPNWNEGTSGSAAAAAPATGGPAGAAAAAAGAPGGGKGGAATGKAAKAAAARAAAAGGSGGNSGRGQGGGKNKSKGGAAAGGAAAAAVLLLGWTCCWRP
jgi:hypothetical protein